MINCLVMDSDQLSAFFRSTAFAFETDAQLSIEWQAYRAPLQGNAVQVSGAWLFNAIYDAAEFVGLERWGTVEAKDHVTSVRLKEKISRRALELETRFFSLCGNGDTAAPMRFLHSWERIRQSSWKNIQEKYDAAIKINESVARGATFALASARVAQGAALTAVPIRGFLQGLTAVGLKQIVTVAAKYTAINIGINLLRDASNGTPNLIGITVKSTVQGLVGAGGDLGSQNLESTVAINAAARARAERLAMNSARKLSTVYAGRTSAGAQTQSAIVYNRNVAARNAAVVSNVSKGAQVALKGVAYVSLAYDLMTVINNDVVSGVASDLGYQWPVQIP
jgi:hypothetical protein